MNCIFLDQISNEYSSFHLNHSEFPVSSNYNKIEEILFKMTEETLKNYLGKQNMLPFIRALRNSDFFNLKLINKTRKDLINFISDCIIKFNESELICFFEEFINKTQFKDCEINSFMKIYENKIEKQSKFLYIHLIFLIRFFV